MASTEKTNIKSVILSAIKAPLAALSGSFESLKRSIYTHVEAQDKTLAELQTQVAKNYEVITEVYTEMLKYNREIGEIKTTQFTKEQLERVLARNKELEWISSQLYNIVYELKTTGVSNKPMPNYEHPILSRKEMEVKFREQIGIDPDIPLTEEQEEQFENYIVQWFLDNPDYVFEESISK